MRFLLGLVLLLSLFVPTRAEASATAACPYYAINSTSGYKCFQTLGEAEEYIRTPAADGTHAMRKYLVQTRAVPQQGTSTAHMTRHYGVKPRPGSEGPQGFKSLKIPNGSSQYELCGCTVTGGSAWCVPYGSQSNSTNTPALATYGHYCNSLGTLYAGIVAYHASQTCPNRVDVSTKVAPSATPTSFTNSPPDQKSYPANTGTLSYAGGILRIEGTNCNNAPVAGDREIRAASPLTCPAGWTVNPGSPINVSEACTNNESGTIIEYRAPVCPKKDDGNGCPSAGNEGEEDGKYGNPVIAATGAKVQSPHGWNADSMLGLNITYNARNTDTSYGLFGGNWASLLTARFQGISYNSANYAYSDPEGNIENFYTSTNGVYRPLNSSSSIMRKTSSSPCEWTVFEPGRRLVFNCGAGYYSTSSRLLRVEYPDTPAKNLTVVWSTSDLWANGEQTVFPNVPVALVRADGRRLDFFYDRINPAADCDAAARPYVCNAIRMTAIYDGEGNITLFDYNADGRLERIHYTDGTRERFEYGAAADICPSTMPGACTAAVPASLPATLLTGTYEETPNAQGGFDSTRYGIYQYDNKGRAIVTTHPGDAGRTEFRYATSTDATPTVRTFTDATHFYDRKIVAQRINGLYDKPKTITETDPSGTLIRSSSNTYSTLGYLLTSTDFRGVRTDWTFNDAGLPTKQIQAASDTTGNRRTIETDWDASKRLVSERRVYDSGVALPGPLVSRTTYTYNARGQLLAACQFDPGNATAMSYVCGTAPNAPVGVRQSRRSYCEQPDVDAGLCPIVGVVTTATGPRTDVSDAMTYTYYTGDDANCASNPTNCPHRRGELWKVTNALGQSSEYLRYNGMGRPVSIKDANGIVTDLEFSPRGWLTARKVRGPDSSTEADDSITRIQVDGNGQVTKVTYPDGAFLQFKYDAAHRLVEINDALGNVTQYSLNLAGGRTQEQVKDPNGVLRRNMSRQFNHLGQIQAWMDANAVPTSLVYDANGNADILTDALGRSTDNTVDPLNRLRQSIANVAGGTSDKATTQLNYDAQDNLVSVVDPKGLPTSYGYNGLGDQTQMVSPDTGTTMFGYDAAGQVISETDARGVTTQYSYDAIGRVTLQDVPTAGQDVTFDYDVPQSDCSASEQFGVGRLAKMTDESGNTRYCYDRHGNVVRKVQQVDLGTTLTTGATYDSAGNVIALTYPSGAIVTYTRNGSGQVTRVDAKPTAAAAQVTLVSNMTYLPFAGSVTSIAYGNGRTQWRSYDQNYRIDAMNDGVPADGLYMDYAIDAAGRITAVNERTSLYRTYQYDGLDRLTAEKNGAINIESFTYDASGDRQTKTVGASTSTNTYAADSHRLTNNRTYDASGNIVTQGTFLLPHDDRGRLREFHISGVHQQSYVYNGFGERVLRIGVQNPSITNQFVYDESGHLLGEYNSTGGRIAEYVWVEGLLVGVLKPHGTSTYQYVETDALGTPRAVINPVTNTTIWRWDLTQTAFGDHSADNDPDANGVVYNFNLRYPGQYYNGLDFISYNYYRDYDARTGRYLQSDPIGLRGGINTYAYANGTPLTAIDAEGLATSGGSLNDLFGSSRRPGPRRTRLGEEDFICVDVRCYEEETPGVCSAGDGWKHRDFVPNPNPVMSEVNQMEDCECARAVPRRPITDTPEAAGPNDYAELASVIIGVKKGEGGDNGPPPYTQPSPQPYRPPGRWTTLPPRGK
jgi:RHS repeat-associated protein